MKTLLLLRHAKSSWGNAELDDFQRPLAPRGKRAARAMGDYMARLGLRPDFVLCSPAVRTLETWGIVAVAFGGSSIPKQSPETLYLAEPGTMLSLVRSLASNVETCLLIGHNPGIATLALGTARTGNRSSINAMAEKYPTGALTEIVFDNPEWQQAERGRLVRFVRPRDLEDEPN